MATFGFAFRLRFAVETREDCQILQFFSVYTKRCIVGPLVFTQKHENRKSGKNIDFLRKWFLKTVGLSKFLEIETEFIKNSLASHTQLKLISAS
jgi:hypothetical protein